MKRYNESELIDKIIDCMDRSDQLSDWERGFMSTCLDTTDKHIMLSQEQRDIIHTTYNRVTADE
jgi:hypothetical protein